MAVPVIESVRKSDTGGTDTTVDFLEPTGWETGDLCILVGLSERSNTNEWQAPPSGWAGAISADNSQDVQGVFYFRVLDGTESWPITRTHSSSSDYAVAWTFRISGQADYGDFHDYLNATSGWEGEGSVNSSLVLPSITTTVDDCLIIAFGGTDGSDINQPGETSVSGTGWPSSQTDYHNEPSDNSSGVGSFYVTKEMPTAGSTEAVTINFNASDGCVGYVMAIAPKVQRYVLPGARIIAGS